MASLSSLIVQRQVATVLEVEQAIARQVIHGGDLVTNLLEVAPSAEPALNAVLGESVGLPPAPWGRFAAPDAEVLALIPAELCLAHSFFPLRVERQHFVIATPTPLAPSVEESLRYSLGRGLMQLASPMIRVREGIAAHYGIPLDPRQLRLVQKLDEASRVRGGYEGRGLTSAPPPRGGDEESGPLSMPKVPSMAPSTFASGVPSEEPEPRAAMIPPVARIPSRPAKPASEIPPPRPLSSVPPAGSPTLFDPIAQERADAMASPASARFAGTHDGDADGAGNAHARQTVPTPIDAIEAMEASASGPNASSDPLHPNALTRRAPEVSVEAAAAESEAAPSTEPDSPRVEPRAPIEEDSPPPPSIVNPLAVHRLLRRELEARRRGRTARRKGPFARPDAEKELEAATTADELIDIFFAFVSQFFEYSALFLVHGDIAEGRDAWGPGSDREKVLGIGVPLDLPSSFARARTERTVVFTRMNQEDLDVELRRDLGRARPSRTSTQAAVVPISLKTRAVALLYGDDGGHDVTVSQLGDLFGFSALASANLERIALLKKRGQVPSRQRPDTSNVVALARALHLPLADGATLPAANEMVVSPGARSIEPPPPETDPFGGVGLAGTMDAASLAPRMPPAIEIGSTRPSYSGEEPRPAPVRLDSRWPTEAPAEEPAPDDARPDDARPDARPDDAQPDDVRPDVTRDYDETAFVQRRGEPGRISGSEAARPDPTLLGPGPGATPRLRSDVGAAALDYPHAEEPEEEVGYDGAAGSGWGTRDVVRSSATRPLRDPPLRREEEDEEDATRWLVELGGTPAPAKAQAARRAEYAIIPDRQGAADPHAESQRLRDAALYGPYGPLLMKATLGGIQAEEALAELEREAEASLPKLVAVFPGPLLVDRFRLRDQLPPASDCGPLLKLLVMLRRHALGFMTVRSTSPDVEQRFWATHVLGELLFPEAAPAVLPRLLDDDVMVRRVARRAAAALVGSGAAGEPLKTSLENMIQSQDEPVHRRVLAIEAVGDIRAAQMLPVLVSALADSSEAIVESARCSLMLIARQDMGTQRAPWETWWQMNRHKHRVEWLIDALTHDTASLRRAAGDELKQITKEYFGYYDDLPQRERERAQQKYREWWAEEGQFRFR